MGGGDKNQVFYWSKEKVECKDNLNTFLILSKQCFRISISICTFITHVLITFSILKTESMFSNRYSFIKGLQLFPKALRIPEFTKKSNSDI